MMVHRDPGTTRLVRYLSAEMRTWRGSFRHREAKAAPVRCIVCAVLLTNVFIKQICRAYEERVRQVRENVSAGPFTPFASNSGT